MKLPYVALSFACAVALFATAFDIHAEPSHTTQHASMDATTVDRIIARPLQPGRNRPVIAVIGENSGTEMTDYVIPYSILTEARVADVTALAMKSGPMIMRPTTLKMLPQATVTEFDAKYPNGADYVIVPAVTKSEDADLIEWITNQGRKGATIVSICDGALVLGRTGLLKGKRATGHWFTHDMRRKQFPETTWFTNKRFVVDGNIVSSAGISAAMPTALALVEAIGGRERAHAMGALYGVTDWSTQHNSDQFGEYSVGFITVHYANGWFHSTEQVGVPVTAGMDDIALALTMDAYSRTGRSRALAVAQSGKPFSTRNGLTFLPDQVTSASPAVQRVIKTVPQVPVPDVLNQILDSIRTDYGRNTADGVAADFEYPHPGR